MKRDGDADGHGPAGDQQRGTPEGSLRTPKQPKILDRFLVRRKYLLELIMTNGLSFRKEPIRDS